MASFATAKAAGARLVILYGVGGLSDIGRHAVQEALDQPDVKSVRVLTPFPDLLKQSNWECGCPGGHDLSKYSANDEQRLQVIHIKNWKGTVHNEPEIAEGDDIVKEDEEFSKHFEGATAVISCLGNRQPGWKYPEIKQGWNSYRGNRAVVHAMQQNGIERAVVISSIGIEEDQPALEFHFAGKAMAMIFATAARTAFRDLTLMERTYRKAVDKIDFLLVRPVGLGEGVLPSGTYHLQKEKHKDRDFDIDMAKKDVAKFLVEEALNPTLHKTGVVIGGELPSKK